MTEQELRSLNRKELLEIMIEQGKRRWETSKAKYEEDLAFLKSEHEKDMDYLRTEYEKEIATLKRTWSVPGRRCRARRSPSMKRVPLRWPPCSSMGSSRPHKQPVSNTLRISAA